MRRTPRLAENRIVPAHGDGVQPDSLSRASGRPMRRPFTFRLKPRNCGVPAWAPAGRSRPGSQVDFEIAAVRPPLTCGAIDRGHHAVLCRVVVEALGPLRRCNLTGGPLTDVVPAVVLHAMHNDVAVRGEFSVTSTVRPTADCLAPGLRMRPVGLGRPRFIPYPVKKRRARRLRHVVRVAPRRRVRAGRLRPDLHTSASGAESDYRMYHRSGLSFGEPATNRGVCLIRQPAGPGAGVS